jgi:hypothetical protein
MSQGFYQILGVEGSANSEAIAEAYHDCLGQLVRRLRAARKQGADVSILEGQERTLREAMTVLSDPIRRQRYDAYRRACADGMPDSAEALWDVARTSLVDPVAVAAVEVLRTATTLDVGNPFPDAPKPRRWVARPVVAPPAPKAPPQQASPPAPPPPPVVEIAAPKLSLPPLPPIAQAAEELEPTEQAPIEAPPSLDDIPAILARFGPDGRFMRAVRELRHLQLEDMAKETRISERYLHAIESNDFDNLPAGTFVRGYVKEVARALGVADTDLVEGYMGLFSQHRG